VDLSSLCECDDGAAGRPVELAELPSECWGVGEHSDLEELVARVVGGSAWGRLTAGWWLSIQLRLRRP